MHILSLKKYSLKSSKQIQVVILVGNRHHFLFATTLEMGVSKSKYQQVVEEELQGFKALVSTLEDLRIITAMGDFYLVSPGDNSINLRLRAHLELNPDFKLPTLVKAVCEEAAQVICT